MKKQLVNILFLSASFLLVQTSQAQDKERNEPKFQKTKSYSKTYPLGGSDKISLSNQFGEMKLITWDKNEIKVDITIAGKADDEKRAQEILDKITIEDGKSGNTVSFKTKFADDKWNHYDNDNDNDNDNKNSNRNSDRNENRNRNSDRNENHNEGMDIDYVVYLPSGNSLKAENQFGKMIVPDYRGEADLTCKFGSLTAGKISNAKQIDVEFGEANITSMTGGDLSIKFSQGTVNNLSGVVKSDLQFSQVKLKLDNDTKGLTIDNSYSTVYLDVDKSFSASYDINTSMGEFTNKSSFTIKDQNEEKSSYGPSFNKHYTGTSGGGSSKIKISSSFGEVILGHNMQVDLTDKKKNKTARVI